MLLMVQEPSDLSETLLRLAYSQIVHPDLMLLHGRDVTPNMYRLSVRAILVSYSPKHAYLSWMETLMGWLLDLTLVCFNNVPGTRYFLCSLGWGFLASWVKLKLWRQQTAWPLIGQGATSPDESWQHSDLLFLKTRQRERAYYHLWERGKRLRTNLLEDALLWWPRQRRGFARL